MKTPMGVKILITMMVLAVVLMLLMMIDQEYRIEIRLKGTVTGDKRVMIETRYKKEYLVDVVPEIRRFATNVMFLVDARDFIAEEGDVISGRTKIGPVSALLEAPDIWSGIELASRCFSSHPRSAQKIRA